MLFRIIAILALLLYILDIVTAVPAGLLIFQKITLLIFVLLLVYKMDVSSHIIGFRKCKFFNNRDINLLLLFAFICFFLNSIIQFAAAGKMIDSETVHIMTKIGFIIGTLILVIISVWAPSKKLHKSLVTSLTRKKGNQYLKRSILILIALSLFLLVVISPLLQVFVLLHELPFVMAIILLWIFLMLVQIKEKRHFWYKIKANSTEFLQKFMQSFTDRKTILIAIAGIFILNIISNMLITFTPMFLEIGQSPSAITSMMIEDAYSAITIDKASLFSTLFIYFMNFFALLCLAVAPYLIWLKLFKKKDYNINLKLFSIFLASLLMSFLVPVFRLEYANGKISLLASSVLLRHDNLLGYLILAVVAMFLFYILLYNHMIRKGILGLTIAFIYGFIASFVIYYMSSLVSGYVSNIIVFFSLGDYFGSILFSYFLVLITVFYVAGLIIFIMETLKEYKHIHLRASFKKPPRQLRV